MGNEVCITKRVAAEFCVAASRHAANATGNAANSVLEGTQAAYEATKGRIDIARAAKQMLDDGGEGVKQTLLAKNDSKNATTKDRQTCSRLSETIAAYDVSVGTIEAALVFRDADHWNSSDEWNRFERLAAEYKARAALMQTEISNLQSVPDPPDISAIEEDAISLLLTRMNLFGTDAKEPMVPSEVSDNTPSQNSDDSTAASASVSEATASSTAPASAAATAEVGLVQRARESAQAARQAANEWVETAEEGKKMASEGGEAMIAKLVAKKASVDSTSMDQNALTHMASVCEAYEKAVQSIRAAEELKSRDDTSEPSVMLTLATNYQTRMEDIRRVLKMLTSVPENTGLSSSEQDALVYSSWKNTLGY
eukprot:TRINITY_DN41744_c0_g1_i1.p1 TRINITY_DN41744_c0_g1~~TRINITY_DN41744_c0_g1_i1.p1  ORF type:complete len:368 (-),score=80.73 TRINITY_DN41744_c0_g1_i1:444-1547(-)